MAKWLLLLYRLPGEPSAPRVRVWRALKRLEGAYLQDGVYAHPATDLARDQLATLAHDVRNDGGEATLVEAEAVEGAAELRRRFEAARKAG